MSETELRPAEVGDIVLPSKKWIPMKDEKAGGSISYKVTSPATSHTSPVMFVTQLRDGEVAIEALGVIANWMTHLDGTAIAVPQPPKDQLEQVRDLAMTGLSIDGAHHKQEYLWEILKLIGFPDDGEEYVVSEADGTTFVQWGLIEYDGYDEYDDEYDYCIEI